jgi:uncharacterized protein (DUF1015 family)
LAQIAFFRGVHYNPKKIVDISLVATPPYDIIAPEEELRYRERHPNNIIRIILPVGEGGGDRYQEAAHYFQQWEKEEILIRDEEPSLYPYQQLFAKPSGGMIARNGFIALVKLEPLGQGGILPHEKTSPKPVEDRLRLTEACSANLSQVFTLYSDPAAEVEGHLASVWDSKPRYEFRDDNGVIHRLWQLGDRRVIAEIAKKMQDKTLIIADGHHRYKTALLYRDKMRGKFPSYSDKSPFEYTTMYLTPIQGEGLVILPTHRLVSTKGPVGMEAFCTALKKDFSLSVFNFNDSGGEKAARGHFFKSLDKKGHDAYTFGLYMGGEKRYIQITLKKEARIQELLRGYPDVLQELDVTLLDGYILKDLLKVTGEEVGYLKGRDETLEEVHQGNYSAAFLLHPPTIQQINRVVDAGEIMPRKTTFFYPKVATGLVINKIISGEAVESF